MTAAEVENWKHERDIARSISNPEEREIALQKVYDHRDDLQMKCIQHQADRIKTCLSKDEKMEKDIAELRQDLAPCIESDKDYRSWKMKIQGGIMFWKILKFIATAGGGAFIYSLLTK